MPSTATAHPGLFRQPGAALPNLLAFAYVLAAQGAGAALLIAAPAWTWLPASLLLGHGMIIAAYLLHEFAHHSIFRSPAANTRAGVLMTWLTGSCYAGFEQLRRKHMRHHVDRADVVTVDVKRLLERHPLLRRLVLAAEWAWIPAVELLLHAYVIALPFRSPTHAGGRSRVWFALALRGSAATVLALYAPQALLGYAVAYLLMITVLRFADAYQHTYDAYEMDGEAAIPADKLRDRAYEHANIYSNLVSLRHPWLNLLILNFGYHNAHHERPVAPWHSLPALHAQLYPGGCSQLLPMRSLLAGFHRHRCQRIVAADYGSVAPGAPGTRSADAFLGAVGVSFLTAV